MAYLGNTPVAEYYDSKTEQYNGDGNTTIFTLSREVATANDVEVIVNNVQQDPYTAFSASGTTLTFTEAPTTGSGNILVTYRNYLLTRLIPDAQSVTESMIEDGAITSAKIAPGTVIAADILDGTIDNNKLVTANITGGKLVANTITSREIADNAILANNIINGAVTADKLAPGAALSNGQLSVVSSAIAVIPDSRSGFSPYKILGQIQPTSNVLTTIYTVPASTNTMITTIVICNQSSNTVTINVAANLSGSAVTTKNYIVTNFNLGGAETLVLEPRISLNVGSILSANITGANASQSNVSINAFGVEII